MSSKKGMASMATSYKDFIAELTKAGAFGKPPQTVKNILDTAEMNLGVIYELPPMNTAGRVQVPIPKRLIEINSPSNLACDITVTIGQFVANQNNTIQNSVGIWGPLTGIVEFGSGGAFSRIEFDLPAPTQYPLSWQYVGSGAAGASYLPFLSPLGNALSFTVFGSSVRVLARNDATFPLTSDVTTPITLFSSGAAPSLYLTPSVFVFVSTSQAFGGSGLNGRLRKTIYYGKKTNGQFGVPSFAKRMRIIRNPVTDAVRLLAVDAYTASNIEEYIIPANSVQDIEVNPYVNQYNYVLSGAHVDPVADPIPDIRAIFDLAV